MNQYNRIKKISVITLSLLTSICSVKYLQAQGITGYFTQAEKLFASKQYYEAAQYYEKYLSTETGSTSKASPFAVKKKMAGKSNLSIHNEAVYHLAECYRYLNHYVNAEKWYKEATGFSRKAYPAAQYWYGVSLRANQKYAESLEAFTNFQEYYTHMDDLLVGADKELENLKFILEQKQKLKPEFTLTKLKLSASGSAYAAATSGDSIYFSAAAATPDAHNQIHTVLYKSALDVDRLNGKVDQVNVPGLKGKHTGLASFSPRGNKMFFTQWFTDKGEQIAHIYRSELSDSGWTRPVRLGEPVNMPGSSSTQPFVTTDGKYLLFASNREGGVGGYDIWYATLDSNANVLTVTNMGNIINTAKDEFSPSYHTLSRQLLYSSNGRIGMGGFDIYYARGDFQLLNWEKPLNAGAPINSSKDDLHFISTDEDNLWNTGLLSSDRDSDCCLEVFAVKQNNAQHISGTIIDCNTQKPIPGASLTVKDPKKGKTLLSRTTDASGTYHFSFTNTSRFEITATKEGYDPVTEQYTLFFESGNDTLRDMNVCLLLTAKGTGLNEIEQVLANLTEANTLAKFSFNKASLGNAYHTKLDSLAAIMQRYPDIVIEIGGHTDTRGNATYNLTLAQKRVDACIDYLNKKGISKERLVGKAYGECCPLEPDNINGKDIPAARERNRRVEYKLLKGDIKD